MITKQRVIMHRGVTPNPFIEHFQEDFTDPGHPRNMVLSRVDWAAIGSPEVITVTIEPGDLLNDDPISGTS